MDGIFVFEAIVIAFIGLISGLLLHLLKKEHKKTEVRAILRREENVLMMQWTRASVKLSVVTALAVQKKEVNGDMEKAILAAQEAETNYQDFTDKIAAGKVSK